MQRHSKYFGRKLSMAVVDLLLAHGAFIASFYIRFGLDLHSRVVNLQAYFQIVPLLSVCVAAILYFSGLYANWLRKSKSFLVHSCTTSAGMIVLASIVLSFWERAFAFPRAIFFIAFVILALLLTASRLLAQHLHKSLLGSRSVLILARDHETASTLARKLGEAACWYRVHKILTVCQLACLPSVLPEVDTVILGEMFRDRDQVVSQCAQAGKEVLLVPAVSQLLLFNSRTQLVDDLLMLSIEPPTLSAPQRALKNAIDLAVSVMLAVLTSPLMLLAYCIIRLDSSGPAIYRQERVGLNGKVFSVFKFRTMRLDAEKHSGPVLASEHDPRITRVGRFLRASRIDELPQLLNVIRGDMSFVGPRPERMFFVEQFTRQTPGYRLRLNVKPGITGLAQIWGKYSTSVEDKLRLDLLYTTNYSPILDLNIIIQTLRVVLLREGAEGVTTPSFGPSEPPVNPLSISLPRPTIVAPAKWKLSLFASQRR
jgi:exopolysaccharide biosynthesis polyprenyl glycosylphosphotransferase